MRAESPRGRAKGPSSGNRSGDRENKRVSGAPPTTITRVKSLSFQLCVDLKHRSKVCGGQEPVSKRVFVRSKDWNPWSGSDGRPSRPSTTLKPTCTVVGPGVSRGGVLREGVGGGTSLPLGRPSSSSPLGEGGPGEKTLTSSPASSSQGLRGWARVRDPRRGAGEPLDQEKRFGGRARLPTPAPASARATVCADLKGPLGRRRTLEKTRTGRGRSPRLPSCPREVPPPRVWVEQGGRPRAGQAQGGGGSVGRTSIVMGDTRPGSVYT